MFLVDQKSFKVFSRMIKGIYTGVSRKFHWCFKEIEECFVGALNLFQRSFTGILEKFKGCLNKVSNVCLK